MSPFSIQRHRNDKMAKLTDIYKNKKLKNDFTLFHWALMQSLENALEKFLESLIHKKKRMKRKLLN